MSRWCGITHHLHKYLSFGQMNNSDTNIVHLSKHMEILGLDKCIANHFSFFF